MGQLRADENDSYGSLISSATWSADSRSILYLGENNAGNRELFRAPVTGGPPEVLTSPDQNVETFDVAADTIVYTADPPTKPASSLPGEPINTSASDVTGLTLPELLFPEDWGKLDDTRAGLWVVRGSRRFEVKDPNSHQSLVLSALNDEFKPIIAPDGHTAVVAIPAANVPPAWETYTPAAKEFGFKAKPPTPKNMADFMWPTQYGLLDLEQGTFSPLVDAPIAFLAGYFDFPFAAWSPDGSAILVSGSFLPLPVGKSSSDPLAHLPCTAVVVRFPDRQAECVVRPRSAEKDNSHPLSAFDGRFVGSADEVRIRLRSYNEIRVETYHRQNSVWTLVDTHPKTGVSQGDVSISLRQALNSPPALWASDQTGHGKKLWDPAPQLSSFGMGQASVYHWKDSSGYDWIGGLIKPVGFKAGRRYPLVIQTHGFHNEGEFITDGAFTTAFAARELAAAGFVVLEVRDRHDHMETADEAADMVRGFETAIAQLNAEGVVDPNRVGIIGFSRTCYYVESALIHDSLRYAAASITDGVDESYLQALLFNVDQGLPEGPSIYGTSPFGLGLKNWVDAAPGFHLDKVQTPLMITAITSGSILEEWEIYSSLRQQGRPVSLVYIMLAPEIEAVAKVDFGP